MPLTKINYFDVLTLKFVKTISLKKIFTKIIYDFIILSITFGIFNRKLVSDFFKTRNIENLKRFLFK